MKRVHRVLSSTFLGTAKELLATNEYINVATVATDGRPWNTPVYAVYDQDLNFYWSSWKKAEHSKNIRANAMVFFTMYDSTRKRGHNNRRCLYLEGKAIELEDELEVKKALGLLYGEGNASTQIEAFLGEGQRRIYRAVPESAWLNDKSERQVTSETIKMRVELSLDKIKQVI